jgi:hypothetical protein
MPNKWNKARAAYGRTFPRVHPLPGLAERVSSIWKERWHQRIAEADQERRQWLARRS